MGYAFFIYAFVMSGRISIRAECINFSKSIHGPRIKVSQYIHVESCGCAKPAHKRRMDASSCVSGGHTKKHTRTQRDKTLYQFAALRQHPKTRLVIRKRFENASLKCCGQLLQSCGAARFSISQFRARYFHAAIRQAETGGETQGKARRGTRSQRLESRKTLGKLA